MKSLKFLLVAALLLSFTTSTQAESTSESVLVKRFVKREKMLLIERQGDENPWLINYKGSCNFSEGERSTLGLYNYLDAYEDTIGGGTKCSITRAEPVNLTLYVRSVYSSGSTAYLVDEEDQLYRMRVDSKQCPIRQYEGDVIYGWRYQKGEFDEYDDLFLPYDSNLTCNISSLSKVIPVQRADGGDKDFVDTNGPTQVTDVRATPGNAQVYLTWGAAKDNVAVDHYLISYSRYRLNPEGPDLNYMPKQISTNNTSYVLKNLENNEEYFFYVLAVDAAGNTSSRWSTEKSTSPNGAIYYSLGESNSASSSSGSKTALKIHQSEENSFVVRFAWNKNSQTVRQTVILKEKGAEQNKWIKYNWPQDKVGILKYTLQKGVLYQLTVKNYSETELLQEEVYEFSV